MQVCNEIVPVIVVVVVIRPPLYRQFLVSSFRLIYKKKPETRN